MALLHAVHFDAGVVPSDVTTIGAPSVSSTVARTGSRCLRFASLFTPFNNGVRVNLATGLADLYVQFAWYSSANIAGLSTTKIFRWEGPGGTILGGLKINNVSGLLEVYTRDFVSLVATGIKVFNPSTWYVIELHLVIGDSGSITVRVDLIEDSAFSGDTKPGADTTIDYLRWGNTSSNYSYCDDIIVHDTTGAVNNSWPDGSKVYYLLPTGDGATKDWTPSTGTDHYALVDEVPPSATDNLQATAIDNVDTLTFDALPGDAQSVKAVIPEVYAFKGSSTAPTRLNLGIDINGEGVEYSGDQDLGLAQGLVRNIWEARPGGGYFSVADIGDLSLYLKSAA
jgi:hypothetical protein